MELPVTGRLPVELDGRYLRNGPNPVGAVDPARFHWFTGDGMVHGVRLRDGKAEWYRNRWVRSTAVSEALGESPKPGERHGGMDTANTNVIGLAGRTYAIVEAGGRPVELSDELETIGHSDLGGTLPNGYTAHPKVDPATGSLHAIAYHWALPNLQYVVVGADGVVTPGRVDRGRRRPDGPRLLDHRALDGGVRPPRDVRSRCGDARGELPVPLERGPPGSGRAAPARRQGRRRALVRRRAVLRLPSAQRVRRRRPRRPRRRPLRPHVRRQPAVPRGGAAVAVALDARHRHWSCPRAAAVGRPARVPARRRARRRAPPRRRLGVGRRYR